MKNRLLKFRVWDTGQNRFLNDGEFVFNLTSLNEDLTSRFVAQQFTGFIAKDNKELYEGDIVKFWPDCEAGMINNMRPDEDMVPEYTAGEIKFINYAFCVCQKYFGRVNLEEFSVCDCCPGALEIIGNIFENPELIK